MYLVYWILVKNQVSSFRSWNHRESLNYTPIVNDRLTVRNMKTYCRTVLDSYAEFCIYYQRSLLVGSRLSSWSPIPERDPNQGELTKRISELLRPQNKDEFWLEWDFFPASLLSHLHERQRLISDSQSMYWYLRPSKHHVKLTKKHEFHFCKILKTSKNMNFIFCKLQKPQKTWISFFVSLKNLKKHEFHFLQA